MSLVQWKVLKSQKLAAQEDDGDIQVLTPLCRQTQLSLRGQGLRWGWGSLSISPGSVAG